MALCKVQVLVGALLLVTTFQMRMKQAVATLGEIEPEVELVVGDVQAATPRKDLELTPKLTPRQLGEIAGSWGHGAMKKTTKQMAEQGRWPNIDDEEEPAEAPAEENAHTGQKRKADKYVADKAADTLGETELGVESVEGDVQDAAPRKDLELTPKLTPRQLGEIPGNWGHGAMKKTTKQMAEQGRWPNIDDEEEPAEATAEQNAHKGQPSKVEKSVTDKDPTGPGLPLDPNANPFAVLAPAAEEDAVEEVATTQASTGRGLPQDPHANPFAVLASAAGEDAVEEELADAPGPEAAMGNARRKAQKQRAEERAKKGASEEMVNDLAADKIMETVPGQDQQELAGAAVAEAAKGKPKRKTRKANAEERAKKAASEKMVNDLAADKTVEKTPGQDQEELADAAVAEAANGKAKRKTRKEKAEERAKKAASEEVVAAALAEAAGAEAANGKAKRKTMEEKAEERAKKAASEKMVAAELAEAAGAEAANGKAKRKTRKEKAEERAKKAASEEMVAAELAEAAAAEAANGKAKRKTRKEKAEERAKKAASEEMVAAELAEAAGAEAANGKAKRKTRKEKAEERAKKAASEEMVNDRAADKTMEKTTGQDQEELAEAAKHKAGADAERATDKAVAKAKKEKVKERAEKAGYFEEIAGPEADMQERVPAAAEAGGSEPRQEQRDRPPSVKQAAKERAAKRKAGADARHAEDKAVAKAKKEEKAKDHANNAAAADKAIAEKAAAEKAAAKKPAEKKILAESGRAATKVAAFSKRRPRRKAAADEVTKQVIKDILANHDEEKMAGALDAAFAEELQHEMQKKRRTRGPKMQKDQHMGALAHGREPMTE